MLRNLLIIAWSASVVFFVWEFIKADSIPQMYSNVSPTVFRLVDVAFLVLIGLTLYYLITNK